MLPYTDNLPAHQPQFTMVFYIPDSVSGDFLFPEIRYLVFPQWESVTMPKIPIYEDGNFHFWESDVGFAGQFFDMFTEAETALVQFGAYPHLKPSVFAFDAGHAKTAL
jgi:hypothetical protein